MHRLLRLIDPFVKPFFVWILPLVLIAVGIIRMINHQNHGLPLVILGFFLLVMPTEK